MENYRRNTPATLSSAWKIPVSVLAVVDLSHQTSHSEQRRNFKLTFTLRLQSSSPTVVFILKDRRKPCFPQPLSWHLLLWDETQNICQLLLYEQNCQKFVSSTEHLSHSFALRVSLINLFAFIKLFIYEFLLKTTENPKDRQKGPLVTSAFHGSTKKMRKHLNLVFCITTPAQHFWGRNLGYFTILMPL